MSLLAEAFHPGDERPGAGERGGLPDRGIEGRDRIAPIGRAHEVATERRNTGDRRMADPAGPPQQRLRRPDIVDPARGAGGGAACEKVPCRGVVQPVGISRIGQGAGQPGAVAADPGGLGGGIVGAVADHVGITRPATRTCHARNRPCGGRPCAPSRHSCRFRRKAAHAGFWGRRARVVRHRSRSGNPRTGQGHPS